VEHMQASAGTFDPVQKAMTAFFFLLILFLTPPAWSQQQQMPDMKNMPGMTHGAQNSAVATEDPAIVAERLASTRESEFNHHLAGFLVILAGIFLLVQDPLAKRWPSARYVWPICFLAAGLFLLVFSDTEIWPFGPQTPWYAITHNLEDLQHKTFSVILLALGYVELQRARGRFKSPWSAWFFPIVAGAGAVLLLFHVHSGNMHVPHAMEIMEHIKLQHRRFAAAGFGVALTSALAESPIKWRHVFSKIWPLFLIVLGILLMLYTE
jgi:copper resistance protein D